MKTLKLILKKSPTKFVRTLFNISDEIWYLTGDKSTDFNFYSKRFILMNIYLNSLIYFLVSKENDFSKLEIFVEKQIRAVLLFGKLKEYLKTLLIQNNVISHFSGLYYFSFEIVITLNFIQFIYFYNLYQLNLSSCSYF